MAKIIGVTVGTTTPRPNWSQTNTKKSDFIKNKPEQDLPPVTAADNEKVLQVEDGKWKAKQIADANALVSQHNNDENAHPALASAIDEVSNEVKNLNVDSKIANALFSHTTNEEAHNDIRILLQELSDQVNHFLDVDDTKKDQLSELLALIDENIEDIENLVAGYVKYTDIINNLTTNLDNKALSAAQGVELKRLIEEVRSQIATAINAHNADGNAHAGLIDAVDDLDTEVRDLKTKVTALENAKPDMSGYVTTEQFESALGAYITDIDSLVGGGIEGGEPAPTLISFTIAGTSYQAEDGMTWAQWVDSDYNTAPICYLSGTSVMYSTDASGTTVGSIVGVLSTSQIAAGAIYSIDDNTGSAN